MKKKDNILIRTNFNVSIFSKESTQTIRKAFGSLDKTSPIYHDTSEEQKRAHAYVIAGYVPFGYHLEKAKENITLKSGSENNRSEFPYLDDFYLGQTEQGRESSIDFEDEFEDFDPYNFDTGAALPDLITDLSAITREKREYTGRIDHIIQIKKKQKIYTEGRITSDSLKAIASGEEESYQSIPNKFSTLKGDPKKAIGKMASSAHVGPKGQNDRHPMGEGSHQGSMSSMPQGQEGGQSIQSLYKISDLVHPSLNMPLKNHQQVTFRLVKQGRNIKMWKNSKK